MGRALLVVRLVAGDIKRRRLQSALLLVMLATTTTTLTLGFALRQVSQSPFARTRAATHGADVVAQFQPSPGSQPDGAQPLAPLEHASGVSATAGPFPVAFVRLTAAEINVPVQAEGRNTAQAAVDQPRLTAGRWVTPGSAVLEQGLADSLNLHLGQAISVDGHTLRVGGIALTTAQSFYPAALPGLIWVTRNEARSLATPSQPLGYVLELKLEHAASAPGFGNGAAADRFANATSTGASILQPWQQIRSDDYKVVRVDQAVVLVISTLLALLAIASIAVVVGGRMAEQTRRVGLLKAVGATPRLVAMVLLAENLLLALAGAAVGLLVGALASPALANPGSGLITSSGTPPLTLASIAWVVLVAVAVAAGATLMPAAHGARISTVKALNDPVHPPQRRPRLIALSARLPVPLLLGLRLVARRFRRSILTAASLTIAVTMVVATLTIQHGIDVRNQHQIPTGMFLSTGPGDRVTHLVILLSAVLIVLAAINAIFTSWATAIDAERSTALARALGATPGQISACLTTAQLLPGVAAACLGIPAGLAIYAAAGGHLGRSAPPILWLIAVIPGTLLVVAALTAIPARIVATRPVAEVLRAE